MREQRVNVALGPHAQQVDVEIRRRVTWCGTGGQHLFVGQGRGVQIAAEVTITGGHRVHLVRWNVDVIEQRPPGLLEIALVIVFGNVAFVAPEQVHLGPFNLLCLGAEVAQKRNPVAAPGQHDQRLPSGRHRGPDGANQALTRGRDQNVAIGEDLDATAHRYCTFLIPSSAAQ
ncbi:Uncharacterised protein [Mycobacterium tuberculosis]|uniref:Uncharacterized protein n=1 Tax=Mycobacterium tuberculosis TaxID=1773 RepID=A0A0T9ENI3_MYCTX|nr:Uncharacterised protein [Mycobacterium tuberculosis]CFE83666.1 Uncharacterised protein [Mycobacterium tuberculosis]CFS09860.1 Uncharacterised protein [Mycobacterium tuberculosis]CFS31750.1 Uncharacterised protein [Mycobacterium tuberculosis]CFS61915.1 Uncharacterised protein [Mycobacterium tuberculosis]